MIIGKFTQNETGFIGNIRTLTLSNEVALVANDKKSKPEQPDYNVFSGDIEIGAAWHRTSNDAENYISITIDDPSFSTQLYLSIIKLDEAEQLLVWSRHKPKKLDNK